MKKIRSAVLFAALVLGLASCNQPMATISGEQDGHNYVDLGLPSGKMWATGNMGATSPEQLGDRYKWGHTTPTGEIKGSEEWTGYQWSRGTESQLKITKYCNVKQRGDVDSLFHLEPADDAARANWGGLWRMPTLEEVEELKNGCEWEWCKNFEGTGIQGKLGTSKSNGNKIFFPFRENYVSFWTSTLNPDDCRKAYYSRSLTHNMNSDVAPRKNSMEIRPVFAK